MALLMAATPNFEGPDPSHGMERRVAARSFLGIHISNIFSKGGAKELRSLSFLTKKSQFCKLGSYVTYSFFPLPSGKLT
jgi:hypothetical protein